MNGRWKSVGLFLFYFLALTLLARFIYNVYEGNWKTLPGQQLILSIGDYGDPPFASAEEKLIHRIRRQPFNIASLIIFCAAIIHTFFAHYFTVLSKRLRNRNILEKKETIDSFGVEVLRFMGEVEVIFGLWVIPLFLSIAYYFSWGTAINYVNDANYTEPIFVVVIMALASTGPIIKLAEDCMQMVAKVGKDTVKAWWWTILTLGPVSGSLITEPGAMTISALLLGKQFYELTPRPKFAYATLGLLFTNISVGGVLTNFAAPPVLMVSSRWHWGPTYMLEHFGWKAIVGILFVNAVYFYLFRNDFKVLEQRKAAKKEDNKQRERSIPFWISLVHVFFLVWTVVHNHYPAIFVGTFLLFLGFYQATLPFQKSAIELRSAILVGFFLAGLVLHGSLQAWWIEPILGKGTDGMLLVLSAFLTSFNDNAEITFLASLIPSLDETMKYVVVAGAISGGGLTVIANAPNPSGQSILSKYFKEGISAVSLLAAALFPAVAIGIIFYVFRGV